MQLVEKTMGLPQQVLLEEHQDIPTIGVMVIQALLLIISLPVLMT